MSVLLVTDDVDDDISIETKRSWHDQIYKQIKQVEYDLSGTSYSILESSSSIIVKSNQYYREDRRRRLCRLQTCLVQPVLTYMFIVLLLAQNLHWPLIFLSLSSMNIMTVKAADRITKRSLSTEEETIRDRSSSPSNNLTNKTKNDEQFCLPFQEKQQIDQFCSKTCRARKYPFEDDDNSHRFLSQIPFDPFCSKSLLDRSMNISQILEETNENQCRQTLKNIIDSDQRARIASQRFQTYMDAIDSASEGNLYSITKSNCQKAYRTWVCSVNIPFFSNNQRILPCQTICDEVERICPTFRPSDYEPLFAGQPLFYCNGGIVTNSDYNRQPYCFDKCHVDDSSEEHHSDSVSSSFQSTSSISTSIENLVTTPKCFQIQLIDDVQLDLNNSFISSTNQSIFVSLINNRSLTSSTKTFRSSSFSLHWFIFFVFLFR